MIDTVNLHLRPGDRIEAHDGPTVPYLTIRTADYRSTVHVFLGTPTGEGDHEAAWRQLDELEAAVGAARRLLMRHVDGPEPGPDDPTDEPTDDPAAGVEIAHSGRFPDVQWSDDPAEPNASAMLEAAMDATLAEVGYHAPDQRAQALDARQAAILAGARPLDEAPETEAELRAAWGDR